MAVKKFYAVKVGRNPGIYTTWEECKKQVTGYTGALFKSFLNEQEANEYVCCLATTKNTPRPAGQQEQKYLDIFVDGSYQRGQYSWAFVVYDDGQEIFADNGVGEDVEAATIRNIAGELAAATMAIKWTSEHNKGPIVIHHDYTGIAAWALGDWKAKNKFTQAYAEFVAPHLSWIIFNKVAGHSGIAGNVRADKLAGEAFGEQNSSQH
jgi:ribonuclease HI